MSFNNSRTQLSLRTDIVIKLLLLWTRAKKIRALPDMAHDDGYRRHIIPVVLLGLLSHFLTLRWEVHRQPRQYWVQEYVGSTIGW